MTNISVKTARVHFYLQATRNRALRYRGGQATRIVTPSLISNVNRVVSRRLEHFGTHYRNLIVKFPTLIDGSGHAVVSAPGLPLATTSLCSLTSGLRGALGYPIRFSHSIGLRLS